MPEEKTNTMDTRPQSQPSDVELRRKIALQVRLAMQDETLSPADERDRRRTQRAEDAADTILALQSTSPVSGETDSSGLVTAEPEHRLSGEPSTTAAADLGAGSRSSDGSGTPIAQADIREALLKLGQVDEIACRYASSDVEAEWRDMRDIHELVKDVVAALSSPKIEEQPSVLVRAMEALEPFANLAERKGRKWTGDVRHDGYTVGVPLGDLRRAARALDSLRREVGRG